MTQKAILFVDDEPNILSAIKRMLRSMRQDYDFHFAASGQEALQIMDQVQISVVVSDMRMPGMDGAELLSEVQEKYPRTIRIMLTGQADDESVIRTVSVVHQFLTKPCEPEKLKEVLTRSSSLHDLMTNDHLKEVITGIGGLPSIPSIFAKLQEALKNPDVTADEVAAIIEQDIAMTAKLLQLVNSSFFGLYSKVESVSRAVKLLGLDTVKILVLGVQIFSEIRFDAQRFPLESLWNHSMLVAKCAKKIAAETVDDVDLINNAFIGGMLHDIGRLVLLANMMDEYLPLVEKALTDSVLLHDLEKARYVATHCDIGAYLVSLWGFTGDIVEAVAFHNDLEKYPANEFTAALAVNVADHFYFQHSNDRFIGAAPMLNLSHLEQLGFSENIAEWSRLCQEIIAEVEGEESED